MAKVIKELKGHSNGKILLMQSDKLFVRKIGDVSRNIERYKTLHRLNLSLPEIYFIDDDIYDMEYISSLDIKTYLTKHQVGDLVAFIQNTIDTLADNSIDMNYTKVYEQKLAVFDFKKYKLPFTSQQLIDRLPKILPKSHYHGDLTLENILYRMSDKKFMLIDPLTTEYDSYVFDMAKLRQDLVCGWFIRNDNVYFNTKLKLIADRLKTNRNFENDYILILMLMRVLPYTKTDSDREFLTKWIEKLWK